MARRFKKGDSVTYTAWGGRRILSRVVTAHRNGEVTIRTQFFLTEANEIIRSYLGYLFTMDSTDLTLCETLPSDPLPTPSRSPGIERMREVLAGMADIDVGKWAAFIEMNEVPESEPADCGAAA